MYPLYARLGVVLVAGLVVACKGNGDGKESACEQLLGCGCSPAAYASVDECLADIDALVEKTRQEAANAGLVYDDSCYDASLGKIGALECGTPSDLLLEYLCPYCAPVHGDKPVGSPCTRTAEQWSDCAGDLVCVSVNDEQGVCISLCRNSEPGEVCRFSVSESSSYAQNCVDGYRCGESGKCEPDLAAGAACTFNSDCGSDYCNSENVCGTAPGAGQGCDGVRCGDGLVCDDASTCVAPPPVGQPCIAGQCARGGDCDDSQMCAAERPFVCEIDFEDEQDGGEMMRMFTPRR